MENPFAVSLHMNSVVPPLEADVLLAEFVVHLDTLVLILEFIGTPAEVLDAIVVGDAIDVIDLGKVLRIWEECKRHETMNEEGFEPVGIDELNASVSVTAGPRHQSTRAKIAYLPIRADGVGGIPQEV